MHFLRSSDCEKKVIIGKKRQTVISLNRLKMEEMFMHLVFALHRKQSKLNPTFSSCLNDSETEQNEIRNEGIESNRILNLHLSHAS